MAGEQCLVEKMLNKLSTSRSSMEMQITALNDVLDKSNNALLQIEAARSVKPAVQDSDAVAFKFKKETVTALANVVDNCMHIMTGKENTTVADTAGITLEDYMELAGQRSEYLAGNIRKIMAVWDVVQQMRLILQRQEMELEDAEIDDEKTEVIF